MKQVLAGILIATISLGALASEQGDNDFFTAERLYNMCSKPYRDGECIMFLAGAIQGMGIQAYMNGIQDDCIPIGNKSISDIKNIVIGHLAQNKDLFPNPAASALVLAMGTDGCKAKLG